MVQASSRSVLVLDDLSSKRAVPGKLKFESNHVTITTLRYFTMEPLIDLYLIQSFSDSSSDGRKTFNVQFSSQVYHVACMSTRGETSGSYL